MKIKRSNDWIKFKDVEIGEVFVDNEEEIAMKIEPKFHDGIVRYNAINLDNGEFLAIESEENYMVKILDCELVIK